MRQPPDLDSAQRERIPNLLVIGAGKAGTSSLHAYLDAHPQASMSDPKELNFYGRERNLVRLGEYLEHFDPRFEVRGESSPSYSQYPRLVGQPDRIRWLNPAMRLIYLVRDPLPRAIAHWSQQVAAGVERRDLSAAFADIGLRNLYVCASSYATQLDYYLRSFPTEQILVIDQHDLRERRELVLRRVFEFAGIEPGYWSPAFDLEVNPQVEQRRPTELARRLTQSPLAAGARRLPPGLRTRARAGARWVLSRRVTRPEAPAEIRERLEHAFEPEVKRLRELTGQGFESWSL